MLKSVQRSVTVASAAVDNAFGAPSSTGGVGQRSSVVASSAQERHSLLANDGMMVMSDHPAAQAGITSPDRVVGGIGSMSDLPGGAPKPPKLMKMSSRHIKMKKMMDNITTKLKLHSRGDNIAFGRRDRGDASGKSYNVEIPKNMIVLILIGFFLAPLAFGLYVLFRQLFASEEVHSRYSQQHHSSLGSGAGGKQHPAAYHITQSGDFSNATTVASTLNATSAGIDVDGMDQVLPKEEESASVKLPEASSEEAGEDTTSTVGDQEDGPEPNLAAETSAATDDEKNTDAENNESVPTDVVDADSSVSTAEKGVESQQEIGVDDNKEVDAIDKSDEKETDAKGESDDEEKEETPDKDESVESDENADAKGESQVDVDTDKKEEEEKSSDENADGESDGTEEIKEKDGSVR